MIFINATFLGVLSTIGYILLGLIALMFMIVVHELGHYLAGKILGFKIAEFGIGFGPAIFKRVNKKNGEIFSIRPIPLGGFCRFEDEDDNSSSPSAFNNQKAWKRIIVLFSGAFFNFISGLIIITIFFASYGQLTLKVDNIYPDSVNATNLSLEKDDVIIRVDGKQLNILEGQDALSPFQKAKDRIEIVVIRDGQRKKIFIEKSDYTLGTFDAQGEFEESNPVEKKYGFGFSGALNTQKFDFFSSISRAFSFMFFIVYKIFEIFGRLFTGEIGLNSLGGPVSTIQVITQASQAGFASLTFVVSIISANLAIMNLMPLPALDGSRIVFCIIEMIRKKPINKKIEGIIHTIGFILLILFAVFIDLFKFLS